MEAFDLNPTTAASEIRRNGRTRHRYEREWSRARLADVAVAQRGGMALVAQEETVRIGRIVMEPGAYHTLFLVVERDRRAEPGAATAIEIIQVDAEREEPIGGLTVRVEVVPEPLRPARGRRAAPGVNGQAPGQANGQTKGRASRRRNRVPA